MGTLKTTNIQTITGSGTLTLGTSGETLTVPTGVTVGGLMANTPAFHATKNNQQNLNHAASTKIELNTELFDTDNAFDSTTNYRFTVPSGKAGKYVISATLEFTGSMAQFHIGIWKNGSNSYSPKDGWLQCGTIYGATNTQILDLAAGDYVELYGLQFSGGTATTTSVPGRLQLSGFRLTGA